MSANTEPKEIEIEDVHEFVKKNNKNVTIFINEDAKLTAIVVNEEKKEK